MLVGTHIIKCTVTKETGLSENAQVIIVVNSAVTAILNQIYNTGLTINYAGLKWIVYKDTGTSVYLLLYGDIGVIGLTDFTHINNYLLNTWIKGNSIMSADYNNGYITSYGIPTYDWFYPCYGCKYITAAYISESKYFYTSTVQSTSGSTAGGNCYVAAGYVKYIMQMEHCMIVVAVLCRHILLLINIRGHILLLKNYNNDK